MSTEGAGQFRCLVNNCPMTGGIFLAGPQAPGICAYHHGTSGYDLPRVTQILLDWECVTFEINTWRRALLGVSVDKEAMAKAWTRLQPALGGGWEKELSPEGKSYVQWGQQLERFVLARVKEALQRKAA